MADREPSRIETWARIQAQRCHIKDHIFSEGSFKPKGDACVVGVREEGRQLHENFRLEFLVYIFYCCYNAPGMITIR